MRIAISSSRPKDLPGALKPKEAGGLLDHSGTVEIVASENRDGTPIKDHLRWGVYIVFKAGTDFMRRFLAMHDFLRMSPVNMVRFTGRFT